MLDSDPLFRGLLVFGLAQSNQRQAETAEYQRQQLNLLREHKGLPTVPPPDNGPGWLMIVIIYLYTLPFILLLVVFGAVNLWEWNPLVFIVVGGLVGQRLVDRYVLDRLARWKYLRGREKRLAVRRAPLIDHPGTLRAARTHRRELR